MGYNNERDLFWMRSNGARSHERKYRGRGEGFRKIVDDDTSARSGKNISLSAAALCFCSPLPRKVIASGRSLLSLFSTPEIV